MGLKITITNNYNKDDNDYNNYNNGITSKADLRVSTRRSSWVHLGEYLAKGMPLPSPYILT